MDSLWIDSGIMALKRTPAERQLLARICYRAAGGDGHCRDSNRELGLAIGVHFQSVSDMVQRLDKAALIVAKTSPDKANARTLTPLAQLLTPYQENADRYKSKADSKSTKKIPKDYKSNADSTISKTLTPYTPITDSDYMPNADRVSVDDVDPISQTLTPYQSNADSYYKDKKTLENEIENKRQQQQPVPGDEVVAEKNREEGFGLDSSDDEETEKKDPPQPPPSIEQVRGALAQSGAHWRYAFEQIKIAKSREDYAQLIEMFITQQECDFDPDSNKPLFPPMWKVRNHFKNWLGKRPEINNHKNGTSKNTQPNTANTFGQGAILPSGASYRPQSFGRRNQSGNGIPG